MEVAGTGHDPAPRLARGHDALAELPALLVALHEGASDPCQAVGHLAADGARGVRVLEVVRVEHAIHFDTLEEPMPLPVERVAVLRPDMPEPLGIGGSRPV